MKQFNFSKLMRKVHAVTEPNAKELLLWKALAVYEQTVVYADDYFMKVKSEIGYLQKEKELLALSVPLNTPILPTIPYLLYLRHRIRFEPYQVNTKSIPSQYQVRI